MSKNAWLEHFSEQAPNIKSAYESSGQTGSILAFAIKEHLLDLDSYIQWAMQHLGLPYLQSQFFLEKPPSRDFFHKWANLYPWSTECLPVAEWDGTLIVTCLELPQDFPAEQSCAFVLSHPERIQQLWINWHPQQMNQPAAFSLTHATSITNLKKSDDSFSFEDLDLETSKDESAENGEENEAPSENEDAPLDNELLADFVTTGSEVPPANLTSLSNPLSLINSQEAQINAAPQSDYALDTIKNINSDYLTEKIELTLSTMKQQFEKALILTNNSDATTLKVFAWDKKFDSALDKSATIPLKMASIFSIVSKTYKPFHGYVSPNDTNEQFFDTWNQGQIPDHVTIVPLLFKQQLVGMLMGFAEKSAYNRTSLHLAESLAKKLLQELNAA